MGTRCIIPGLSQSQMESAPHHGKQDHGGKRGTTLTGAVVPPSTDEYGKLDQVYIITSKSKIL